MKFLTKFILIYIGLLNFAFSQTTHIIHVEGMHCPLCTAIVRQALLKVDGVISAKASLRDKNAVVNAKDKVNKNDLLNAVATTGYTGKFIEK